MIYSVEEISLGCSIASGHNRRQSVHYNTSAPRLVREVGFALIIAMHVLIRCLKYRRKIPNHCPAINYLGEHGGILGGCMGLIRQVTWGTKSVGLKRADCISYHL
jgi:hypothetical protein